MRRPRHEGLTAGLHLSMHCPMVFFLQLSLEHSEEGCSTDHGCSLDRLDESEKVHPRRTILLYQAVCKTVSNLLQPFLISGSGEGLGEKIKDACRGDMTCCGFGYTVRRN